MQKSLLTLLSLYGVSLVSSIAGMELFSTLILLIVIVVGLMRFWRPEKAPFEVVRVGPDWALWFFWSLIILGGFAAVASTTEFSIFEVIREGRWILTLYAMTAALTFLRDKQSRFLPFMAGLVIILAIYSIVQSFTGFDLVRDYSRGGSNYGGVVFWRARGFFNNTMTYSYTLGVMLCFLFAAMLTRYYQKLDRVLIWVAGGLLAVSMVLTFTRGAWVASFLAVATLFFLKSWRLGVKMVIVLVVVLGLVSTISEPIRMRLASMNLQTNKTKSVIQRYDLWRANWAMFKDHPALGVGYGQNSIFVQEYNRKILGRDGFVENAHNNVLQVLAGGGVFVFLLWLYFCGWFFMSAIRLWLENRGRGNWPEVVAMGSIAAQIFFHAGGITQATFFDSEPMHIFVFAWALLVSQGGATDSISIVHQKQ